MKNLIIAPLFIALALFIGCADSNAQQKVKSPEGATVNTPVKKVVNNNAAEFDAANPEHMANPENFDKAEKKSVAKRAAVSLAEAGIKMTSDLHDFGTIPQGKPVSHTFEFVNVSDKPLKLEKVKPACGCTAADYTKEEIPVGGKGFVKATYNAKAAGAFNKSVSVFASTSKGPVMLKFRGVVEGNATNVKK